MPPVQSKPLTQHQKIVAIMCKEAATKKWWKASEIMNYQDPALFVGYEATARLSELTGNHPSIFETKKEGKYVLRRMRFETGKEWYPTAPADIKLMVKRYYKA